MEFQSITDNLTANDIIPMSRPFCKRNKVKNLILSCQMFLDFVDGGQFSVIVADSLAIIYAENRPLGTKWVQES